MYDFKIKSIFSEEDKEFNKEIIQHSIQPNKYITAIKENGQNNNGRYDFIDTILHECHKKWNLLDNI